MEKENSFEVLTVSSETNAQNEKSKFGLALLGTVAASAVALVAITTPFVVPAFRKVCLPYVPATPKQINNILSALPNKHSVVKVAEIGSGDGRVAIEIAKNTRSKVVGLELNPWLVWYSRYKSFSQGVNRKTCSFLIADLWKINYSSYDRVVVFAVQEMMKDLQTKLVKEMKPGSEIVACRFNLPDLEPKVVIGEGIDTVWVYEVKDSKN